MTQNTIIAAGHCCLDVIPAFAAQGGGDLVPGKLIDVGPAVLAPGGSVSNVGLALHHLGAPVRLLGKVGDDAFGRILLDLYARADRDLVAGMVIGPGETTSYSVVLSQPHQDRIFLHCPGANHTFSAADLASADLTDAAILHFGYPPLMRGMYLEGGAELARIFHAARARGLVTSLDMARPDPASEAGQVDWSAILRHVLPVVDAFFPSIEEILFMIDRDRYERLRNQYGDDRLIAGVDGALLEAIAGQLIAWGAALVGLKLGDQGLYLRTTTDAGRMHSLALRQPTLADPGWHGRSLLAPCCQVAVAGTTGAGDTTIAGFLHGLLQGGQPTEILRGAVAVGACSVEQVDATSGIPSWQQVQRRLRAGWPTAPMRLALPGWAWDSGASIWRGPADHGVVDASAI